jgi:hypothetical protein
MYESAGRVRITTMYAYRVIAETERLGIAIAAFIQRDTCGHIQTILQIPRLVAFLLTLLRGLRNAVDIQRHERRSNYI